MLDSCTHCGSHSFERSHRSRWERLLSSPINARLFRCRDCNSRYWVIPNGIWGRGFLHLLWSLFMRWFSVLLWMAVIFVLSSEHFSSARTPIGPDTVQFLVRKFAHWTEYFILGFLLMRALSANSDKLISKRHIVLSVIVAAVYAVTDEWHQSFVPNREAKISDVALDTVGACCGTWLWSRVRTLRWMSWIIR